MIGNPVNLLKYLLADFLQVQFSLSESRPYCSQVSKLAELLQSGIQHRVSCVTTHFSFLL